MNLYRLKAFKRNRFDAFTFDENVVIGLALKTFASKEFQKLPGTEKEFEYVSDYQAVARKLFNELVAK